MAVAASTNMTKMPQQNNAGTKSVHRSASGLRCAVFQPNTVRAIKPTLARRPLAKANLHAICRLVAAHDGMGLAHARLGHFQVRAQFERCLVALPVLHVV